MADTNGKSVRIHTEAFDRESLLGEVSDSGPKKTATVNDVRSIIAEVKKGFNRFIQSQLTYAEADVEDAELAYSNDSVQPAAADTADEFNPDRLDVSGGNGNPQLDRIEENTNTIITELSNISTSSSLIGSVAATAFPAMGAVSSIFGKGGKGFFSTIANGLKDALMWIIKNPVFIYGMAVLLGTIVKGVKSLYRSFMDSPMVKGIKSGIDYLKGVYDSSKDTINQIIDWTKTSGVDMLKNAYESSKEKIKSIIEYFSTHSFDEILHDIKASINKLTRKFGLDLMSDDRIKMKAEADKLVEESKKLADALSKDDLSDDRRRELQVALDNNFKQSQKLAEQMEKDGLSESSLVESATDDADTKRDKAAIREFIEYSKNRDKFDTRSKAASSDGSDERKYELLQKELKRVNDSLGEKKLFGGDKLTGKERDDMLAYREKLLKDVKPLETKVAASKQMADDAKAVETERRQKMTFTEKLADDYGKTRRRGEDAGVVIGKAVAYMSSEQFAQRSQIAENSKKNVSAVGMSVGEIMTASQQLKQTSEAPSRLKFAARNIGISRVSETEFKESSEYLKKTMPQLWADTLKKVSAENGGKSKEEIDSIVGKEVMEKYMTGVKSLFDDFAKGREKNDEELRRIFADREVSAEEIAQYINNKKNADKIASMKPVTVVVKGGSRDSQSSHRSM